MKKRLLTMLVLLVAVATGAWAQTETLLTTIKPTGQTTFSETTSGVVTVTHDNNDFSDDYGWLWYSQSGSLTVEAKEGYTITRCVFKQNDKTPATITSSPFAITFNDDGYCVQSNDMDGVTSIEVYGYAPAPAATTYSVTLAEGTEDEGNWTISPAEAAEGAKVTVTYSGEKKVKSVKAVKVEATPAIDYSTAQLGDLFYSDGTFSTELEAGKTPIGVIAYLDKEGTDDDEISEKSNGAGHGLVLCLKNVASTIAWSTENVSKFSGQEVASVEDLKRTTNVSGYTNTATLTVDAATAEKYPAAYKALKNNGLTAPMGTTGWFLPSAQQLLKMIEGLGGLTDGAPNFYENWFDTNHNGADKLEAALSKAGSGNYDSMTSAYLIYWSSSECTDNKAVSLGVDATGTGFGYGFLWGADGKDNTYTMYRVRPVLAF